MVFNETIDKKIEQAKELRASLEEEIKNTESYNLNKFFESCDFRINAYWMSTNDILSLSAGDYTNVVLQLWSRYNTKMLNAPFKQYIDRIDRMIGTLEDMKSIVGNIANDNSIIMKKKLLFISHASANETFVNALVELLVFLKFDTNNLFCSSEPGYGIPVGENIYGFLRSRFVDFDIFVIFVHSKEFYLSHACLNEMGAAWAFQSKHASILLPGFSYNEMDGAVNNKEIAIKIDDKQAWSKMNSLKEQLVSFFSLSEPNGSAWEKARNCFFDKVKM